MIFGTDGILVCLRGLGIIYIFHWEEIDKEKFANKIQGLEFTIISFPIYDKEHLKDRIAKGVENYGS